MCEKIRRGGGLCEGFSTGSWWVGTLEKKAGRDPVMKGFCDELELGVYWKVNANH